MLLDRGEQAPLAFCIIFFFIVINTFIPNSLKFLFIMNYCSDAVILQSTRLQYFNLHCTALYCTVLHVTDRDSKC